ncbi:MAG: hypothetical protein R2932_59285 [Caldilineaceae bacterium]
MADSFQSWKAGLESPAENAFSITPSDGSDLANTTRGLYVGVSGDVAVITAGGDTVTFVGLAAGIIHPIRAARVKSTGTTATDIVGVY